MDDDREVRLSTSFMLGAAGIQCRPFSSGVDFLSELNELQPGCLLLDLRMPDMGGFEVMEELARRGFDWPVVVMTGHGEIPVAVQAMKLGAVDFLEKPFGEDALLGSFVQAFAKLDERQRDSERRGEAERRIAQLTGRERDVLLGLLDGLTNKGLAERLGISLRTVEMHRANMMARLQAESLAEALSLAMDAGLKPPGSGAA